MIVSEFFKKTGSIEKTRVQLEKEFHKTLALRNKSMNPLPPQPTTPGFHHILI